MERHASDSTSRRGDDPGNDRFPASGRPDPMDLHRRRRRERTLWRWAFVFSLAAHALFFLLWRGDRIPPSPFTAAGPRSADARAAGGMQALRIQAALELPELPVVPLPVPEETIVEPEPEPEVEPELEPPPDPPAEVAELPAESEGTDDADTGQGEGLEGEVGRDDGEGGGDGGVDAEGRARISPPTPRGMVMPPTNRNLRGQAIEVWVFVGEDGRVAADSTLLRPPTRDRDYNRRLIREAAQWVFEPARRDGEPVGAWFPYTIQL